MIALNETNPTAAEVAFFLPLTSDPFNGPGLTGRSFASNGTLGEVQVKLPGGAFFNVPGSQIVEKGNGRYCVQLLASQCLVPGIVYVRASVSGAQPYGGVDQVGTSGGDFQSGDSTARVPFYLPNSTDPVFGAPVTGHVFTTGEVQVALPGGAYASASVANVVEIGDGYYELLLTPTQAASRGKVFAYVQVAGAQRWEGFATLLAQQVSTSTSTATPVSAPVVSPLQTGVYDHVSAARSRLSQEFRS